MTIIKCLFKKKSVNVEHINCFPYQHLHRQTLMQLINFVFALFNDAHQQLRESHFCETFCLQKNCVEKISSEKKIIANEISALSVCQPMRSETQRAVNCNQFCFTFFVECSADNNYSLSASAYCASSMSVVYNLNLNKAIMCVCIYNFLIEHRSLLLMMFV